MHASHSIHDPFPFSSWQNSKPGFWWPLLSMWRRWAFRSCRMAPLVIFIFYRLWKNWLGITLSSMNCFGLSLTIKWSLRAAMNWIVPPHSYVETLIPDVSAFGDRAQLSDKHLTQTEIKFKWNHNSIGLVSLEEEEEGEISLSLQTHAMRKSHVNPQQKSSHLQARERALTRNKFAGTLVLDFPASRSVRK